MSFSPRLERSVGDGVGVLSDPGARAAGVLVAFTNRHGGTSSAPFDTLNLGARVGDDNDAVWQNRRRAAGVVGFDPDHLVLARQVHEAHVIEAGVADAGVLGEGDGLLARARGPVLSILTADCAPVVVAGEAGVAVLHAGWRGIVAGVIEKGVAALGGAGAGWVGPCIHGCCYEVGDEVVAAFEANDLPIVDANHVDPSAAAATQLRRAGVSDVVVSDDCTHCNSDYFSYRRDGVTGRQGAFAALLEENGS